MKKNTLTRITDSMLQNSTLATPLNILFSGQNSNKMSLILPTLEKCASTSFLVTALDNWVARTAWSDRPGE